MTPQRFKEIDNILSNTTELSKPNMVLAGALHEAIDEIRRLAEFVYVPGNWFCPNCGFELTVNIMAFNTGTIGASLETPDPCPNDGTPMQPVTWKRDALKMSERMLDAMAMQKINFLRDSKSSIVELHGEFQVAGKPRTCVAVTDEWTGHEDITFAGENLHDALNKAIAAKEKHKNER